MDRHELLGLATRKSLAVALAAVTAIWMVRGLVRIIGWRIYIRKLRAQGLVCLSPTHLRYFTHGGTADAAT